ncbi:VOC family protein [Sulfurovum sp. CS9]|uniref:VOC family protein n=1 Tax=Sulfurovum sp. CS9 TaxID=3391146 RepID=UPI0039E812B2
MKANNLSSCVVTDKVDESREFYMKNFNAKITFDCGWYINMEIGKNTSTLQFMAPQQPGQPTCDGIGLMYNFEVDDVDLEYERLTQLGNEPVMPLEDHPWGDRGFAILDPNGIMLYIYSNTEPSEDFKQYFK